MEVISTIFSVDLNYDLIYSDAYKECREDMYCQRHVPNFVQLANEMSGEFYYDASLSNQEKSEKSTAWLERAIYDDSFTSKYREIFHYYSAIIARKKLDLAATLARLEEAKLKT